MKYTPENISTLLENEVFCYGSNESGFHGAGAAKVAMDKFGAVYGHGIGFSPNLKTYGIPTKDHKIQTLPLEDIAPYIVKFFEDVLEKPHLTYYVTAIGTNLAGYTYDEIDSLFVKCLGEFNENECEAIGDCCLFPEKFRKANQRLHKMVLSPQEIYECMLEDEKKYKRKQKELYYVWNGEYVGNTMLWWQKESKGYTMNLNQAHKFTREEAQQLIDNPSRKEEAFLCSETEKCIIPTVNHVGVIGALRHSRK
jgi:hypothetical protein